VITEATQLAHFFLSTDLGTGHYISHCIASQMESSTIMHHHAMVTLSYALPMGQHPVTMAIEQKVTVNKTA
jgi:hypothetical protein